MVSTSDFGSDCIGSSPVEATIFRLNKSTMGNNSRYYFLKTFLEEEVVNKLLFSEKLIQAEFSVEEAIRYAGYCKDGKDRCFREIASIHGEDVAEKAEKLGIVVYPILRRIDFSIIIEDLFQKYGDRHLGLDRWKTVCALHFFKTQATTAQLCDLRWLQTANFLQEFFKYEFRNNALWFKEKTIPTFSDGTLYSIEIITEVRNFGYEEFLVGVSNMDFSLYKRPASPREIMRFVKKRMERGDDVIKRLIDEIHRTTPESQR